VLYLGIPAIIFVSFGAYLSKFFDSTLLELILAIFLIGFSILFLIAQNVIIQPTRTNSIIGGSISGFVAGLLGTGGTIRGMTLAAFNLNKDVFIATSALIDFGVDLSRGIVYFSNGYMHWHDMKFVLILIAVSIVGTYIGKKVLDRVSETTFKRIVLFVILGIGIATLMQQII
jgi:uncharacterized membrane protein YfcA